MEIACFLSPPGFSNRRFPSPNRPEPLGGGAHHGIQLLAAAGIVLLLLTTGLLHRPPHGPNVIGGTDEATGIFVTGTNWLAFGVKMAVCVGAMVAGGILLYRTRR